MLLLGYYSDYQLIVNRNPRDIGQNNVAPTWRFLVGIKGSYTQTMQGKKVLDILSYSCTLDADLWIFEQKKDLLKSGNNG